MAWENIEERLKRALKVKVEFPAGSVWLGDAPVDINEWLTSIAETDEELTELDIPRLQFLQNRWTMEKLLDVEWEDKTLNRRTVWVMYVGRRAYLFFSDGIKYELVAAIEPKGNRMLYQAVISKLLQNPNFVPKVPIRIKDRHPDLLAEKPTKKPVERHVEPVFGGENFGGLGGPVDWMHPDSRSGMEHSSQKEGHLSKLLAGWIGRWIDLPLLGFLHGDVPDTITAKKGEYVMKYKPTYGDKQREEQKRKKEEALGSQQTLKKPPEKQTAGQPAESNQSDPQPEKSAESV